MRKNNRKGFTIVELVIVIAVIAILASVMIPTISGVIAKANDAAAQADARNAYTQYVADAANADEAKDASENVIIKLSDNEFFAVVDGKVLVEGVEDIYATAAAALEAADIEGATLDTADAKGNQVIKLPANP